MELGEQGKKYQAAKEGEIIPQRGEADEKKELKRDWCFASIGGR